MAGNGRKFESRCPVHVHGAKSRLIHCYLNIFSVQRNPMEEGNSTVLKRMDSHYRFSTPGRVAVETFARGTVLNAAFLSMLVFVILLNVFYESRL